MNVVLNCITTTRKHTHTPTHTHTHSLTWHYTAILKDSKNMDLDHPQLEIFRGIEIWRCSCMLLHVPSIPGWLNAMDEGVGWFPFQWLRSVAEVPDCHLFTSTSSFHILRPVPRLLHFGSTGVNVFERLREVTKTGHICSTTWPSLLVALCHQIFSPAGVLGKFLTSTQYDKCQSTKIRLKLGWRLQYIAIHPSIHPSILGILMTIELMANLSFSIHSLLGADSAVVTWGFRDAIHMLKKGNTTCLRLVRWGATMCPCAYVQRLMYTCHMYVLFSWDVPPLRRHCINIS